MSREDKDEGQTMAPATGLATTPFLCNVHEERIQRMEDAVTEQAGQNADIKLRVATVSEQITELREVVETGFKAVHAKIEAVSTSNTANTTFIAEQKARRAKMFKWAGLIFLPMVGAVGAGFGKQIVEFLTRVF